MSIIEKIKANDLKLSKKQKTISEYLVRYPERIPFMSLNELSQELNVSEVTILNYCKSIDVESFTELKKAFQVRIQEKLSFPGKMKSSLDELESIKEAYVNAMEIQRRNFNRLGTLNSIEAIDTACSEIMAARKVFLCGMGVSRFISQYLNDRFRSIGVDSVSLNLEEFNLFGKDLIQATDEDLFILIAFPDYSPETVRLRDYLVENQLPFLSVTNCAESDIAEGAKALLMAENKSLVFYNFLSNTFALLEVLLTVLSYRLKDTLMPDLKKILSVQDYFRKL